MKRAFVVLCAFLLLAAFMPRPASAASIDLGVKGGFSLSNLNWSGDGPEGGWSNLTKPIFGAFVAFNLSQTFAIQPELYLWQGGAQIVDSFEGDTYKMQLLFNYLHVPVLAKVRLIKEGKVRPILFAGPAFSFLMTAKQKAWYNGSPKGEEDVKEYLKSTDLSAVFGGGLEFHLNKIMLVLDVRYNLGFTNIDKESEDTTIKNKAIMIMAGIGF